jgi:hypothetical protein
MNTIQIIYTTEEDGQFVANLPFTRQILRDKKTLIIFAVAAFYGKFCFLPDYWQKELYERVSQGGTCHIPENMPSVPVLYKLSLCITSEIELPAWYHACNGKILAEELRSFDYSFTNKKYVKP